MKKALATLALAPLAFAAPHAVQAADLVYQEPAPVQTMTDEAGGVRLGYLTCDVGGGVGYVLGSSKTLDCVFQSTVGSGVSEAYTGEIRKFGVDVGFTTHGKLVWAVFAPTAGYHHGSLGGVYQGATAEATLGAGAGANVLVGGTKGSIELQTVSLTGQIGLNAAATGTSVTLTAAN
ncbi:DUF992 domain-containing protein [Aurantimonas sp. MSK8Z-1]|uniref:DUF992 domain-containing protein n=1 Tax=Mangrovibrevibacter kandeliae TaxID=2968473 RepID=UPI002117F19B|nr:DUF992 domain-containing protein [Aurantimonas sp. MSK8Z-1]MCW4115433.1 DUF992 domain-containing protein [Aurantimonas sp. MSK8Z-1]